MVFAIAIAAIALMALRPARLPAWIWPLGAAIVVVALGLESPTAALGAIASQWNIALFILGLMGLSAAAEESGAFAWITALLLARAGGSRRRLFVLLFLLGAGTTLLLSNDATAIVLTPIVYRAVAGRGDSKPYLFACAFVAGTASFGLPFSNPANVLILPRAHLVDYVVHLGPPQLAAIGLNLGIFLLLFARTLRGRYEFEPAGAPSESAIRSLRAFVFVGLAYLVALALSWPLGPVAIIAAILTLAIVRVPVAAAARHLGWSIFVLLGALFVLLDAVARAGFVQESMRGLAATAQYGSLAAIAIATGGAALASNLLNNLPVAIASSYVVAHDSFRHLAYPMIVGVDLGPNLTATGSLATILWLAILRERGIRVSPLEFLRLGVAVVLPTIAISILWLWLVR